MIKKSLFTLTGLALSGLMTVNANADIITGVTTDNGTLDGNLVSFTTATDSFSDLLFSTGTTGSSQILYPTGTTPPATASAAISDQSPGTGTIGAGSGATFDFGAGNVGVSDVLFVIFNAGTTVFYQGPGLITAIDAGGNALGTSDASGTTVFGDEFTTYTAERVGASTLSGRPLGGVTIDVASFGVADASLIAGFIVPGEDLGPNGNVNSFDPNLVGLAVIPEPASLALLGLGSLALLGKRRK
ncbi:PEP-CTERM sorting domain-containing protein [Algisphaera agarilytica]|uniref:Ice-binding protein C-terminal domain-containing protein n=1 Tax=Algisphaera agarilytica TaxID=1385975 RepID=A0A7X0H2Y1_9BACT|nr:PEP-CTERM sorting domain-containing protein [Algisphaera agarilytica]MBB6428307.1 hypothetical protein [Algisphaera agarilytica]